VLIVNADDWGRDSITTAMTLACVKRKAVSSVSAMVFMADSERAAALARDRAIDAGLHLNFTTPFTTARNPRLAACQQRLAGRLRRHTLSSIVYHPGLAQAFDYVVKAQLEEFRRLYGGQPARIDGHHHMHLCANVLWQKLLPAGTIVRRSFSFARGEKSPLNRAVRRAIDRRLAGRHRLADYFFSLQPVESDRIARIIALASHSVVEVETHPVNAAEFSFLESGEILRQCGAVRIAPASAAFAAVSRGAA